MSDKGATGEALKAALADDGDILVTVHGTNDADPSNDGQRWWQRGSAFLASLQERLGASGAPAPHIVPFHWTGANSDHERLKASRGLKSLLDRLDRTGRSYHVIAHSHGGNVVEQTFRLAGRGIGNGLRSITTVGTPFLERRLRLFERLNRFYFLALGAVTSALVPFVLLAALSIGFSLSDEDERQGALAVAIFAPVAALASFLWAWPVLRERTRLGRAAAHCAFDQRWLAVASHRDEAISLLRRAPMFAPKLLTPNSLRRSLMRFGSTAAIFAAIYYTAMSLLGDSDFTNTVVNADDLGLIIGGLIALLPLYLLFFVDYCRCCIVWRSNTPQSPRQQLNRRRSASWRSRGRFPLRHHRRERVPDAV